MPRLGLIGGNSDKRTSGFYFPEDNTSLQKAKSFISNFNYDGVFNALTSSGVVEGICFNRDGTRLYTATRGTRTTAKITQWNLSLPYDLTTLSYQAGKDLIVGDWELNANCLFINTSGTKLFFGGYGSDAVWSATLSTPFDLATAIVDVKKAYVGTQDATANTPIIGDNGTKLYVLGATNKAVYQYTLSTPYDVSTATYSNKSLSVNTQDTAAQGIFFKDDGTKMYMIGNTSYALYSYTLSTPWDVSTGVSDYVLRSYNTTTQATTPRGTFIGDNGTKMYVLNATAGVISVFQYTLSTAYDISTASYASKTISVSPRDTDPWDIFFKSDGTKMYVLGNTADAVFSYTLSTPWDLATAVADYTPRSFSVNTQAAEPYNTYIGDSGTKMFVLNQATNAVFQYTLSTPYNVTTAVYASKTVSVATQETNARGMYFRDNGTKMYIIGVTLNAVFSYTLSTPWDIATAVADYVPKYFSVATQTTIPNDGFIGDNGTKMYVLSDSTTDLVFQYNLSVAWDISSATYSNKSFNVTAQSGSSAAIFFKTDGTKMYIGNFPGIVYQYSLGTAWDISTATYDNVSFNTTTQETQVTGIYISSDGVNFYVYGQQGDDVNQYTLSTPWVINTASFVRNTAALPDTVPQGITFKSDGTKMYIVGSTTANVYEYSLSTPWNVSTISLARTLPYVAGGTFIDGLPRGLAFKDDGSKLFIFGDNSDRVQELSLSVPWQITSVVGRFSAVLEDTTCNAIYISPDGLRMYIAGQTGDDVNQYDLSTAWDTSSATFVRVSVTHTEATATGLFFQSDGSRMYISGQTLDTVREYTLSTPWDVSTITFLRSTYIGVFDATNNGVFISPDGLNMYLTGGTNNTIYQLELSVAWRSSYIKGYFSAAFEESSCTAMYISPDGLNMFISGSAGDDVNQYLLDTAWDISTANYVRVSIGHGETEPRGIFFSSDGTKMYIAGQTDDRVREYNLATPWNVSSITANSFFYYGHIIAASTSLRFSPDGTKMYLTGGTLVYQFNLNTAWKSNGVVGMYSIVTEETTPRAIYFKPDGTSLYLTGQVGDDVNQYTLSTAWNISTASYTAVSAASGEATPTGVFFRPDGTRMYVIGNTNDAVREFNLSTPWSVTTATFSRTISVGFETLPSGVFFKDDGLQMYISGQTNDCVYQIELGTAWDVTSAKGYRFIGADEGTIRGLEFSNDGTLMYISGTNTIRKYTLSTPYAVESAVSSQTLTVNSVFGLGVSDNGLTIYTVVSSASTTIPLGGRQIRQIRMTTPNDLTTATINTTTEFIPLLGLTGNCTNPWTIFCNPDNTKMFVLSDVIQGLYQFSRRFL